MKKVGLLILTFILTVATLLTFVKPTYAIESSEDKDYALGFLKNAIASVPSATGEVVKK